MSYNLPDKILIKINPSFTSIINQKKHLNHQYGEDGMKLNEKQRKELNSFIKDEFFIKEFDYNKIKGEILWT